MYKNKETWNGTGYFIPAPDSFSEPTSAPKHSLTNILYQLTKSETVGKKNIDTLCP